jgi:hypothetical protein
MPINPQPCRRQTWISKRRTSDFGCQVCEGQQGLALHIDSALLLLVLPVLPLRAQNEKKK